MLSEAEAVTVGHELMAIHEAEDEMLEQVHAYWRGDQPLPIPPNGVPVDVRRLAQMSRVNMCKLVIDVLAQSLFVDGFRQPRTADNAPVWEAWQANKLDASQTGVHRAALAYGTSYTVVSAGDPHAVIRGLSPRKLTALYDEDDDTWPVFALECRKSHEYRIYDDEAVYLLSRDKDAPKPEGAEHGLRFSGASPHDFGVTPVVRFRNTMDCDGEHLGEISDLVPLQNQLDLTTFELLVAQHFQSFRQRYVLGWTSDDEATTAKAAASRLWTFDDPDVKVGEFGEVDLGGYLDSRAATIENLATISQTPPHHVLGKLVNLSAEALAAAEAGQRRKIDERKTLFGESWEQTLALVAIAEGLAFDDGSQVVWRDTEARALASTVDALGKMVQMLGLPPEVVWERIPGFTQQDVETAKALAASSDSIGQLTALLDRQAQPVTPAA